MKKILVQMEIYKRVSLIFILLTVISTNEYSGVTNLIDGYIGEKRLTFDTCERK